MTYPATLNLQQPQDVASKKLPQIREDLFLINHTADRHGQPQWQIYDPARHRFFSIGYAAYHMFRRWKAHSNIGSLIKSVNDETILQISSEQAEQFITFLAQQNLLVSSTDQQVANFLISLRRVKQSWIKKVVHGYLFFRIPIFKSDAFLTHTYPYIRFIFNRTFIFSLLLLGCIGVFFVFRHWELYLNTFLDFISWKGLIFYSISIIISKSLHEFGHAYTSKHFGCDVPTIGIAFLVLWPILYTDSTSAWRLPAKKQRLLIDCAGVITEICIACVATFAWVFLPEGYLKSTCFALATVTLISTLSINLNFLMKFDGYYILSDFLGVENLQQRSFYFGKWNLRRILFGLTTAPPEHTTRALRRFLITFAYLIWIYRFFLFLGIAVLVYNLFFKLAGIILFAIEILYFILLPIYREISAWNKLRTSLTWNHASKRSLLLVSLLLILLCWPWQNKLSLPAVMENSDLALVITRTPGFITEMHVTNNQIVQLEQVLLTMESPQLNTLMQRSKQDLAIAEYRLRQSSINLSKHREYQVNLERVNQIKSHIATLQAQLDQLVIKAPQTGKIYDLNSNINIGQWIDKEQFLLLVGNLQGISVYGYVEEQNVDRIKIGNSARFLPEDIGWPSIDLTLDTIQSTNTAVLDQPSLASVYGGSIPVTVDPAQNILLPVNSIYQVAFQPLTELPEVTSTVRGKVLVQADASIPIIQIGKIVIGTITRELGL